MIAWQSPFHEVSPIYCPGLVKKYLMLIKYFQRYGKTNQGDPLSRMDIMVIPQTCAKCLTRKEHKKLSSPECCKCTWTHEIWSDSFSSSLRAGRQGNSCYILSSGKVPCFHHTCWQALRPTGFLSKGQLADVSFAWSNLVGTPALPLTNWLTD